MLIFVSLVTVVKVKWTNGERSLDVSPQDCSTHGNCRLGITDLPPNTLYKIQIQVRLTTERGIALTRMSEVAVYMTKPGKINAKVSQEERPKCIEHNNNTTHTML